MRGFNYKKTVQALNFFSERSGGTINKMKAIKMIWLSDRLHIRKYGRFITNDVYFALPHGPVPSTTRDILEANPFLNPIELEYSSRYIEVHNKYDFISINAPDLNVFSDSDIEVIKRYLKFIMLVINFDSQKYPTYFLNGKNMILHFQKE